MPRVASAFPLEPRASWQIVGHIVGQRIVGRMAGPKVGRMPDPSVKRTAKRLVTLKRRPEFLGVRAGARWATPAFVLEGKRRGATMPADAPRFGFTVSKQVGGAVERNRVKRRLKAAVCDVLLEHARIDYDYVLIARRPALDAAYAALVTDLVGALERVHTRNPRTARARAQRG